MTDVDFGADVSCWDDLDENMVDLESDDPVIVAQSCYHRLLVPRGGLVGDPDYGLDIMTFLQKPLTRTRLASFGPMIKAELLKDDRVDDVVVTVSLHYAAANAPELKISLEGSTAEGPFDFVLTATAGGTVLTSYMATET